MLLLMLMLVLVLMLVLLLLLMLLLMLVRVLVRVRVLVLPLLATVPMLELDVHSNRGDRRLVGCALNIRVADRRCWVAHRRARWLRSAMRCDGRVPCGRGSPRNGA